MHENADPVWEVLIEQGRSLKWLARKMGYSHGYIRNVKAGFEPPSPAFRHRAARAFNLPESILFLRREPAEVAWPSAKKHQQGGVEMTIHATRPVAPLLTVRDTARRLQLGEATVRHRISRGELPGAVRIGRSVRVLPDVLDAWLHEGGAGMHQPR